MEFFEMMYVPQTIFSFVKGNVMTLTDLYICLGVAGGLMLICLVFSGLGLSAMARHAGKKHGWLGFLPFACTWYAGEIAGETTVFGKRMKRVGLYAMLVEILYVACNAFLLWLNVYLSQDNFYENVIVDGVVTDFIFHAERIPAEMQWTVDCALAMEIVTYILGFVQLFLFLILYNAVFRKYYARSPFMMSFLCAVLPLRGFTLFAVRHNTPIDYEAQLRRRMEAFARQQDILRNETETPPPDEPFGDFNGDSKPNGEHHDDSPFSDF